MAGGSAGTGMGFSCCGCWLLLLVCAAAAAAAAAAGGGSSPGGGGGDSGRALAVCSRSANMPRASSAAA